MLKKDRKEILRALRHKRIRRKLSGTETQPRMCVHRSLKNFQVQVIDDTSGKVLMGMSTLADVIRKKNKNGGNKDAAAVLGEAFAVAALEKGIKKVCFDRGGYLYHGRVKAFADAARKGGLEF